MTTDQRMAALKTANEIRSNRAVLKLQLTENPAAATATILDLPWWAERMRALVLVNAASGFGPARTKRLLRQWRVSLDTTLGELALEQRQVLADTIVSRRAVATLSPADPVQVREALEVANRVRTERARLRDEARSQPDGHDSRQYLASVLLNAPVELATMSTLEFLMWGRNIGRGYATRWLAACRIAEGKTVGELTPRQRYALAQCLRGWVDEVRDDADDRDRAARLVAA